MGTSKILIDGVGIDLTQDTVAANKMLSGTKAHDSNGDSVTGSIPSKAAQTYTPGTADQTIAAGQYLSGAQTVKGDANLISGNIRSGKSIFGVAGGLIPGITPSGTKSITANGTHDVTEFANAAVNVPQGSLTSKTWLISIQSRTSGTINLTAADADALSHRTDASAVAVLVPLFSVGESGDIAACVTAGAVKIGQRGTFGGYCLNPGSGASFINDGTLGSAKSVQLFISSSGVIQMVCGSSRYLAAGQYLLVLGWGS